MGMHMKTTIEIADSLLKAAKKRAAREHTTVRALVESGLRHVLAQKMSRDSGFRLRDATFKGEGLAPGMGNESCERLREIAYAGRGG